MANTWKNKPIFPSLPFFRLNPPQPKIKVARTSFAGHLSVMSTVQEIKTAISKLSLEDRAEIAAELCGWTDDDWDRQMKADAATGKFASLNLEADAAQAAGQTLPLNDILH